MKQTQITTYLKLGILLFGISLIVASCQKDDFTNQSNESSKTESDFKITTLRKDKILEKKSLLSKLEKIETKLKVQSKATSINSREVYSEENGFTVNTDYCKEIFDGIKYTYTFPVYRDEDNGFLENLWLIEEADSTYTAYLVQYEFTSEDITAINFRQQINIENKITYIELNADELVGDIFGKYFFNGNCYDDLWVYQSGSNCTAGGNHSYSDGSGCNAWGKEGMATEGGYSLVTTLVPCDGTGGNPSDPSNGGNPPDYNPTNPNSNPNHGGGNQGGSTTPVTCKRNCVPEDTSPIDGGGNDANCQNLNLQSQDTNFTDKLKDLRDNMRPTDETGYVQVPADANATSYNYTAVQGANGNSIDIIFTPGLISGYYHTHYDINNQLSVFSLSDLWSLYELAIDGDIFDDTFTLVLITAHGTKYAIKFSDVQAFVDFGNEWFVDWGVNVSPNPDPNYINKQKAIEDEFERVYGIKPRPVDKNHKNEKNFAKFLDHYDMGLELFKSNDDFTQWGKVNKNVTTTPCN